MTLAEYPHWVPPAVVKQVEQMSRAYYPDGTPVSSNVTAERLAIAPKMENVWRRLQKYRCNNADGGPVSHDDALAYFFQAACHIYEGPDSKYLAEMTADVERKQRLAAQLHEERWARPYPIGIERAGVLLRAAEILEAEANSMILWMQQAPGKRNRGRFDRRSYAVSLAKAASRLFIFPSSNALHTVVADVITVRFNKANVTNKNVASWLEAYAEKQVGK
jgi:hypothetical protein